MLSDAAWMSGMQKDRNVNPDIVYMNVQVFVTNLNFINQ